MVNDKVNVFRMLQQAKNVQIFTFMILFIIQ